MNLETKLEELLAYFDRLNIAKANGYRCDKEISEVITFLRRELEVGVGDNEIGNVKAVAHANELLDIHGALEHDDYMRGMYNGMELIVSLFENRNPVYKEAEQTHKEKATITSADYSIFSAAKTSTKSLCSELVSREGVESYKIAPHGEYAKLTIDKYRNGDTFTVTGPAKIIVVRD